MASLSANCNTLLALLLDLKNDPGAAPAIAKVSMYLANAWLDADGPIKDKWVTPSKVLRCIRLSY